MLYIIPTPVGNLEDMTLRGIRLLKEAQLILCEDTRQTKKLLDHFQIHRPLQAYHKFNERMSVSSVTEQLRAGQTIAMVSDGGTPGISDPGHILIAACLAEGIEVQCLPGATAFVPALINSGFPTDAFTFLGFPPHKKGRETFFRNLAQEERVCIFYESPFRLQKALEQLSHYVGPERLVSVSREISKLYEENRRGTITELLQYYTIHEPRGEIVVVVHPAAAEK
ncbi:MAG: 16S rRNA (cytidine(1402)-2'-O)-methyltransferase [Chitinophagales bacterium]